MTDFTAVRSHIYVSGAVIFASTHNTNETTIYAQHNAAFNAATGHFHTGSAGDAPKLLFTSLDWGDTGNQIDGTLTDHWILSKTESEEFRIEHETLTASRTWSLPDSDDTFAGLDTEQTFSNKSFSSSVRVSGAFNVTTNQALYIDRAASTDAALIGFDTAGVNKWRMGMHPSSTDFVLYDKVSSDEAFRVETSTRNITIDSSNSNYFYFDVSEGKTYQSFGAAAEEFTLGGTSARRQYKTTGNAADSRVSTNSGSSGIIDYVGHLSTTSANGDNIYVENYYANDSAGNETLFGSVIAEARVVTDGSESGSYAIRIASAGVESDTIVARNDKVEINEELELPNTDPPTANLANRNGIVKGWINYTDSSGSVTNSYNVSSITDDDGDGLYVLYWDTNFSGANEYTANANLRDTFTNRIISIFDLQASYSQIAIYDLGTASPVDDDFLITAIGDQ